MNAREWGTMMIEKTEWEVVESMDAAGPTTARAAMPLLGGKWWKWKLAGVAVVALAAIVFFATLIGVLALSVAVLTLLFAGARKVMLWLRRDGGSSDVMKI